MVKSVGLQSSENSSGGDDGKWKKEMLKGDSNLLRVTEAPVTIPLDASIIGMYTSI